MDTKKLGIISLVLTILYFGLQISIINLKHGHHVTYIIKDGKNSITVDELYIRNIKNEKNNYYLKFKVQDEEFNLQLYTDFKKHNYIVKDIKYYKDSKYKCIYPIFKDKKGHTDFICFNQNYYINYTDIKGTDKKLDDYVKSIKEYKTYDSKIDAKESTKIYNDNLIKNHYIAYETYRGVYLVNSNKTIKLFDRDIYTNDVHLFLDNYYLTADYSDKYIFNYMYLINIKNGEKYKIKSNKAISLDSYIMGGKDNLVYLLDRSNKKEYLINTSDKDINLLSDNEEITILENNKQKKMNIYEAINNKITFNNYKIDSNDKTYFRVDKVGNVLSGYYYLYKKVNDGYEVYRSCVQDKNKLFYITTISDIDNIYYVDDYIYFKDEEYIKYYHDTRGIKVVVKNNEFKYNSSLKFGVTIK